MEPGESSECASTSDGFEDDFIHSHHHKSSNDHKNGVVSRVLRSLTNVQDLLKCSVCFDFMYSPIYQCHNGHTLCSSCKPRVLNKCPTCRQQLGDIRCRALEKMAESLELHCKYEEFGCREIIPYHTKLIHEDSCNFRPYNCPWSGLGCSAVGDIPFLFSHLMDSHKADILNANKFKRQFLIADLHEEESCTWMRHKRMMRCLEKMEQLFQEAEQIIEDAGGYQNIDGVQEVGDDNKVELQVEDAGRYQNMEIDDVGDYQNMEVDDVGGQ